MRRAAWSDELIDSMSTCPETAGCALAADCALAASFPGPVTCRGPSSLFFCSADWHKTNASAEMLRPNASHRCRSPSAVGSRMATNGLVVVAPTGSNSSALGIPRWASVTLRSRACSGGSGRFRSADALADALPFGVGALRRRQPIEHIVATTIRQTKARREEPGTRACREARAVSTPRGTSESRGARETRETRETCIPGIRVGYTDATAGLRNNRGELGRAVDMQYPPGPARSLVVKIGASTTRGDISATLPRPRRPRT